MLADGTVFWGRGIGATGQAVGEVCFNTSITGYQEILTDPSYAGQIITFTFPHIGNVGANPEDIETTTPAARGLVVRSRPPSRPITAPTQSLDAWLKSHGIVGLCGVDTRRLTRLIRDSGAPNGVIAYRPDGRLDIAAMRDEARGLARARRHGPGEARSPAARATNGARPRGSASTGYGTQEAPRFHVVAVDYGAKHNILRMLAEHGCRVTVVPATATTEEIMRHEPDGIFLSNGPGDPAATGEYAVPVLRELIETGKPMFGICLGHQMLALALGGRPARWKKAIAAPTTRCATSLTGKVEITSQNHGFVVDPDSLPAGVEATHISLFDGTNEGLRLKDLPVFSVQHHPEASPGPQDSHYLFQRFIDMMAATRRTANEFGLTRFVEASSRRRPGSIHPQACCRQLAQEPLIPAAFRRLHRGSRLSPGRQAGWASMPKRTDINSILIIGAGPIVIGQACEFDYSGAQACKALKDEGYRIVLVNSNPATIMTDPELADATYIEPITPEIVERIIARERERHPIALLPTMGGQTALNTAMALSRSGALAALRRRADRRQRGGDRQGRGPQLFRQAMDKIGLESPKSRLVNSLEAAREALDHVGLPAIIRPSFTLGGTGGGIAYNTEEFEDIVRGGLRASPTHEVLIEESVLGWKEYELEVVRDRNDNCIIVCSIENIDPMGVHTGDLVTVAPALTLTDKEYQIMRNAAIAVLREIGVDTGGSNVQFAVNPADGRLVIIEMNPRVSRSSALASKATGFPIAKIAAKLAVGYTLDELAERDHRLTPASFEPTIDYIVTKMPRFTFEKFPGAEPLLSTSMKSVGEAMAIGRSFAESVQKALRSMETGIDGFSEVAIAGVEGAAPEDLKAAVKAALTRPTPDRLLVIAQAYRHGLTTAEINAACRSIRGFWSASARSSSPRSRCAATDCRTKRLTLLRLKSMGFSDARLAPPRRHRGGRSPRRVTAPARRAPGLQAHRHLRRRVPVADPVYRRAEDGGRRRIGARGRDARRGSARRLVPRAPRPLQGAARGAADFSRRVPAQQHRQDPAPRARTPLARGRRVVRAAPGPGAATSRLRELRRLLLDDLRRPRRRRPRTSRSAAPTSRRPTCRCASCRRRRGPSRSR